MFVKKGAGSSGRRFVSGEKGSCRVTAVRVGGNHSGPGPRKSLNLNRTCSVESILLMDIAMLLQFIDLFGLSMNDP